MLSRKKNAFVSEKLLIFLVGVAENATVDVNVASEILVAET